MVRFMTLMLLTAALVVAASVSTIRAVDQATAATQGAAGNPLLVPSTLPFQAPPFDKITDADYRPALEEGMRQHLAEVAAIADSSAPPTFENTLVALEKSGQ